MRYGLLWSLTAPASTQIKLGLVNNFLTYFTVDEEEFSLLYLNCTNRALQRDSIHAFGHKTWCTKFQCSDIFKKDYRPPNVF